MQMSSPVKPELQIILGCMFSGKTTELMRRVRRYSAIGNHILIINSCKDSRWENRTMSSIETHDHSTMRAIKAHYLTKDYEQIGCPTIKAVFVPYSTTVIGIDEAQFFEDLIPFVQEQLVERRIIIVSGLDGDYQQKEFGNILKL